MFVLRRSFSRCVRLQIKRTQFPPRPKFTAEMESQCEESFLHGGRGPGGQKINKCNSKVQLRHVPTGIVVSCQETRSRERNREIARQKMASQLSADAAAKRTEAVSGWEQRRKRARKRKSDEKYEAHREQNNAERREQEQRDRETLLAMLEGGGGSNHDQS